MNGLIQDRVAFILSEKASPIISFHVRLAGPRKRNSLRGGQQKNFDSSVYTIYFHILRINPANH